MLNDVTFYFRLLLAGKVIEGRSARYLLSGVKPFLQNHDYFVLCTFGESTSTKIVRLLFKIAPVKVKSNFFAKK